MYVKFITMDSYFEANNSFILSYLLKVTIIWIIELRFLMHVCYFPIDMFYALFKIHEILQHKN